MSKRSYFLSEQKVNKTSDTTENKLKGFILSQNFKFELKENENITDEKAV